MELRTEWNSSACCRDLFLGKRRNARGKLVIPNEERDLTVEAKVTLTEIV